MTKRGTLSRVLIILGCVVLVLALVLLAVFEITKKRPPSNEEAVCAVYSVMPPFFASALDDRTDTEMYCYAYGGYYYVGVLTLDSLGLELPVLGVYDKTLAENTPSVYSGSIYDGSLVVYGGNDRYVFGLLLEAEPGEEFTFTDMTGAQYTYEISKITHKDKLPDEADDEDADLTLITKTSGGKYALVKCIIK